MNFIFTIITNTKILKLNLMQFQEGHCNYRIIYDNYIKLEL